MQGMTKDRRCWVYLNEEDQATLKSISAGVPKIKEVDILSALVSASLKACADNGNRLHFPMKLKVADDFTRLNDPAEKLSYKRK